MIFRKKSNHKYWVSLDDIKIEYDFLITPPKSKKMNDKIKYFLGEGVFQSRIILDKNFVLKNGYTSYLIAKKIDMKKVPVYFQI